VIHFGQLHSGDCRARGALRSSERLPAPPRRHAATISLCRALAAVFGLALACPVAGAQRVEVVASTNVYGDLAQQIGGDHVVVMSILTNPNQDPHEFEASPATARAIADARLVIYNGAGYDSWAPRLLAASKSPTREVIEVAKLVHKTAGDNPHLWYEPAAMEALATAVAASLTRLDPEQGAEYARALARFKQSMQRLRERIAALRSQYAGTAVTATEPVFGYMAADLGLKMRNERFQLAVMNGTEPAAAAIAAFENDLRTGAVKVLFYNSQTTEGLAERMRTIATENRVAVVAVTETKPAALSYQEWMTSQLDALDRALRGR
jgi:zinc/manganese transport system substrate-binding protein